jgi:hypothetical protein
MACDSETNGDVEAATPGGAMDAGATIDQAIDLSFLVVRVVDTVWLVCTPYRP